MSTHEKQKLTLRLDKQLIEQAKEYAARHNLSVSALVEAFFLNLKETEESQHSELVRRITGILPDSVVLDDLYGDYLVEKYGG